MKGIGILICALVAAGLLFAAARFTNETVAPLLLNSRIERLREKNLPMVSIDGSTVYCRMKADDFRFPWPQGARAVSPVVTGGFDTIKGSVEARFDGTNRVTASEYEASLSGKIPIGGQVTVQTIPEGLLINFRYFGDR